MARHFMLPEDERVRTVDLPERQQQMAVDRPEAVDFERCARHVPLKLSGTLEWCILDICCLTVPGWLDGAKYSIATPTGAGGSMTVFLGRMLSSDWNRTWWTTGAVRSMGHRRMAECDGAGTSLKAES